VTAQPASPTEGDIYIIAATHTGTQWATFTPLDLAIYSGGTWYAFAPVTGVIVNVAGTQYRYTGSAWSAVGGGSMTNPMTTAGDIIAGGSSGTPQRLAAGTNGYVLTMTSGAPAWAAASGGGGTVAGSDKQIQYNASGAFGAEAAFAYDYTTNTLTVDKITLNGLLLTLASATGGAGLNIPHGAAPTSPTNGDLWTTTAGLYARINGATVGPYATAAGSLTNPMTTTGDIIVGGASGTPTRLAIGATDGYVPTVSGGAIVWLPPQMLQNSQSTAYTLVLADSGKHILHPSADTTARVFTIPANSSVAYPIGTAITIVNQNAAGVITIAITTDTMRLAGAGTTGSRTLAANGIATALKLTSTEWIISGTGLA
jgi:hypothetical protein